MPYDVAVIGGGAAGIPAALYAKEAGCDVVIIEKNPLLAKKILSTGNGRCNFTNDRMDAECYYSNDADCIPGILADYDTAAAVHFFDRLGIVSRRTTDGYYYPYSNRAKDVRGAMEAAVRCGGVAVRLQTTVTEVLSGENNAFLIRMKDLGGNISETTAKCCILSTGGKAAPKSGSTGDGYKIAEAFGHTMVRTVPALVRLTCKGKSLRRLAGLRARATVHLFIDGQEARQEYGEVQFNADGLSGIPVMSLSRLALGALAEKKDAIITLDVFPPEYVEEEKRKLLEDLLYRYGLGKTLDEALNGLMAESLTDAVLSAAGLNGETEAAKTRPSDVFRLYQAMCSLAFPVTGSKGYDAAQTTAGGVPLREIDPRTFASKKKIGLYLCGELLDVDGICGGYNLHFAWASGTAAGIAAAKRVMG